MDSSYVYIYSCPLSFFFFFFFFQVAPEDKELRERERAQDARLILSPQFKNSTFVFLSPLEDIISLI